jgi:mucin-19
MKLKFWPLVIASLSLSGCGSDFTWFPTNTSTNTPTTLPDSPTLSAAISPSSIASGGTSTITYTILFKSNIPAGLDFVETFPSGVIANVTNPKQCGGNLAVSSGQMIFLGGTTALTTTSCTMTATLTGTNTGTSSLAIPISSSDFSQFQGGLVNGVITQTLTVAAAPPVAAPKLTTSITPAAMLDGGTSTLSFTINNVAGNPAQSGLGFSEQVPTGFVAVVPAATSQCGGTVGVTGPAITFSGGQLAANVPSCTITGIALNLDPARVGLVTANETDSIKSTDFFGFLGGLASGMTSDLTFKVFPLGITSGVASISGLSVSSSSSNNLGPFSFNVDTHNTSNSAVNVAVTIVGIDATGSPISSTLTTLSGQLPAVSATQIQLTSTTPTTVPASDAARIQFWIIQSVTVS